MTIPFLGYVRISKVGDRSGPGFISPDVQRETIERLAAANGLALAETIEELDVSGGKASADRRLDEIVQRIESGDAGGLLVWKVSRFSRSLADGVLTADRIAKAGGRIIGSDLDTDAPMGKALLGFLLGWAEEELDARRAGWRDAQVRAVARGAYPSRTPFGYRKDDDGCLTVNPATGHLVTAAFRMRASGSSLGECATLLGVATSTARAILGNVAYLGRIEHGSGDAAIYKAGTHPALTDERTWHLAQRGTGPASRTGSLKGKGLLLGLITCDGCGNPLTTVAGGPPDRRVALYTCHKRRGGGFVCPSPAGARVDLIDGLVWPGIEERTADRPSWRDAMTEAENRGAHHQEAVEELDAFLETALVGALGPELYAREVSRRRDEVARRWDAFEVAQLHGSALLQLGETSGAEHARARARQALESVVLTKSTRGRWQPIEERVEVKWASRPKGAK